MADCAKQSQSLGGRPTRAEAIVQNKANLQEAKWTLTAGEKEGYVCRYGPCLSEKQSQFVWAHL